MSTKLLKQCILEYIEAMGGALDQSIIRRDDDDGKPVIRKLVTFKKRDTRYPTGDNVRADLNTRDGDLAIVVDDTEVWDPEIGDLE
jgi:hypothetical protein